MEWYWWGEGCAGEGQLAHQACSQTQKPLGRWTGMHLPRIKMWCLELYSLLVTRRWCAGRKGKGSAYPPLNCWLCTTAALLQTLIRRGKSTPVCHCNSGFLLLVIKSNLSRYNHPHQPSPNNPVNWKATIVVTNLEPTLVLIPNLSLTSCVTLSKKSDCHKLHFIYP